MNKIIFVEGIPLKGVVSIIIQKCMIGKKCNFYRQKLNEYFIENNMDWEMESAGSLEGDLTNLFKTECALFVFVSGGQQRFIGYRSEIESNNAKKCYLTETELYTADIRPVLKCIADI